MVGKGNSSYIRTYVLQYSQLRILRIHLVFLPSLSPVQLLQYFPLYSEYNQYFSFSLISNRFGVTCPHVEEDGH